MYESGYWADSLRCLGCYACASHNNDRSAAGGHHTHCLCHHCQHLASHRQQHCRCHCWRQWSDHDSNDDSLLDYNRLCDKHCGCDCHDDDWWQCKHSAYCRLRDFDIGLSDVDLSISNDAECLYHASQQQHKWHDVDAQASPSPRSCAAILGSIFCLLSCNEYIYAS